MTYEGVLTKMQTEFGNPIQYYLVFEDSFLNVNQLLGKSMEINFVGFQCLNCGKKKKIFRQGFCYDCFYSSPAVGDWIMKPELSTAHLGIADRDLAYEEKVQLQPHIVYLALSSEVKVGHYADKTNWRKMLTNSFETIDLVAERLKVEHLIPTEVQEYFYNQKIDLYEMHYPVLEYPAKVTSLSLDKTPNFQGKLIGIKGQYLLFEGGIVFNIRSSEGYVVKIEL
jgi:hypothetical protein